MTSFYPTPTSPSHGKADFKRLDREFRKKHLPPVPFPSTLITPPPTPPRDGFNSARKNETTQVASSPALDIASLKMRLALDNCKCGSVTKTTNAPCRVQERNATRINQVDLQVGSMMSLTQDSTELDGNLQKLVQLVHCRHHKYKMYTDLRVKTWREKFPIGDKKPAQPTMSVEDQIRTALDCSQKYTCGAIAGSGKPCRFRLGGQRVQNSKKTIDEFLTKPEIYIKQDELSYFLEVLAENTFCHYHKEQIPTRLVLWRSKILTIHEKRAKEPEMTVDPANSQESNVVQSQIQTPLAASFAGGGIRTGQTRSVQRDGSVTPPKSTSAAPTRRRTTNPADFWKSVPDTSPLVLERNSDGPHKYVATADAVLQRAKIQKELDEPLETVDYKDGHVYLYEVDGNPGFVKLGYTTRTIQERSREWKFECNRIPKVLFPIPFATAERIPMAHRVEQLCIAELQHRNVKVTCDACGKIHKEWFRASPAEAITVIKKWTKWIKTDPYEVLTAQKDIKRIPIGIHKDAHKVRARPANNKARAPANLPVLAAPV